MKILHIVAGLPPGGGIAESVPTLCRHLRKLGHEVTLATLYGPLSESARAAETAGVRLVRFASARPRPLYFSWQMLFALPALVRETEAVHVHSNWTFPVWWGCRCALRSGKPLVMSPRGCLDPVRLRHSAWKKRLVGWLDRFFLKKASVIHVTAPCERDWVRSYLAAGDAEIAVIPNGIELKPRYSRTTRTHEKGEARNLLYLGRLHPLKGLELLVEAWGLLRPFSGRNGECKREKGTGAGWPNKDEPWRLVIAGPDEQGALAKLKAQAEALGLSVSCQPVTVDDEPTPNGSREADQDTRLTAYCLPFTEVVFVGPVYGEEKERVMASADLFVLPTRSENFGIVVGEALSCGVPVITTKGAPWAELLGSSDSSDSSEVLKCESAKVGEAVTGSSINAEAQRRGEFLGEGHVLEEVVTANGTKQANEDNFSTLEFSNFRTSRCGWWIDIGVEPLVDALREAMSLTDEERHAMGENGRRLVETKYRWEAVAERMSAAYSGILNKKA